MEKTINYLLSQDSAVQALVGASGSARIYPVFIDEEEAFVDGVLQPTIIYRRDDSELTIDLAASPSLMVAGFLVDYYADTFADELALGDAIFNALHGAQGVIDDVHITSIKFQTRASLDDTENEGRFVYHGQQVYRLAMRI